MTNYNSTNPVILQFTRFAGDRFTKEIKRVYDILGFDDFNSELIMSIWKLYSLTPLM